MRLNLLSITFFLFGHVSYLHAMDPSFLTFVCEQGTFVNVGGQWHEVSLALGAGHTVFFPDKQEKIMALYKASKTNNFRLSDSKRKSPAKSHNISLAQKRAQASLTPPSEYDDAPVSPRELETLKIRLEDSEALLKFVETFKKQCKYNRLVLTFLNKTNNANENALKELLDAAGKSTYLKAFDLYLSYVDLPLILNMNNAIRESKTLEEISLTGFGIGQEEISFCVQGLSDLMLETQKLRSKMTFKLSIKQDTVITSWLEEMKYPVGFYFENEVIILSVIFTEIPNSESKASKRSSKKKLVNIGK